MPVYLECIQSPTDADWQDLQKIHEETAADGLTKNMNELHNFLSRGGEILDGRFNDRIVGAILAAPCGSSLALSDAGVRRITQRRGVMHQLMQRIQRRAEELKQPLLIEKPPAEIQPALLKRGFQLIDNVFVYNKV